jgi:hypothetical protein
MPTQGFHWLSVCFVTSVQFDYRDATGTNGSSFTVFRKRNGVATIDGRTES